MSTSIPPITAVREQLGGMSYAELQKLADASGVPFTTLLKIRDGTTKNPGIETVRQFFGLIAPEPAQER